MAWGGARHGAGRKPKKDKALRLVSKSSGGAAEPPVVKPSPDTGLLVPPDGMAERQADVWRRYAALAIERGTLIKATVPGFTLLCELEAQKGTHELKAASGGVSETRLYLQLVKQIETLLGRFMLAPFGKPAPVSASSVAVDPDDAFFGDGHAVSR